MDKTIIITGASSGIGLATAVKLAEPGANLVLVARGRLALDDAAHQCREHGANVLVLAGDMGEAVDVEGVYQEVIAAFGSFDVWINNASIAAYGGFLDIPTAQFEKVMKTNVMGYVHGSRAALSHYRNKNTGGILINIASGLGTFPAPYASPYVASKYAVRGLSAALRQESLYENRDNIKVCTVLPATIDTPFYGHAANFSDRQLKAMRPVYPAGAVAGAIVRLIKNPKSEVVVGGAMHTPKLLYGIAPQLAERIMAYYVANQNYKKAPNVKTEGNSFQSQQRTARVSGGWSLSKSSITKTVLIVIAASAMLGIASKQKKGR